MRDDRFAGQEDDGDHYQLSAASWDAKFGRGRHYATDRPFAGLCAVVDEIRGRALDRVLDVGCGDGRNLGLLSEAAGHVCGLDRAEQGLSRARSRFPETTITFVRGDMGHLPFRDASLDALVNVWAMNHGRHAELVCYIAEMARVLRPGGLLFASVSAWGLVSALGMVFLGRKITDASPDGHSYLLRSRREQGLHHFFTKREMHAYFADWRILRLWRRRHPAEAPVRLPFWNILAAKL